MLMVHRKCVRQFERILGWFLLINQINVDMLNEQHWMGDQGNYRICKGGLCVVFLLEED